MLKESPKKRRSANARPLIWLGQSVDTSSICAAYPELNCLPFLTSLGDAIRRPSLHKTHFHSDLRATLGLRGPLMVDSGGLALMANPNFRWTVRDVAKAINRIDADVFVSLDLPPSPDDSATDRIGKIMRSSENYRYLIDRFSEKRIMPVVHGRTLREIQLSIDLIAARCNHPVWVGLGGIVPLLLGRRVSGYISSVGSEVFIAQSIGAIRQAFPFSKIHAFGAGGTRTFPAVFAVGADSADSIGWRQAAGFGSIFFPLKSQRAVRWNNKKAAPRRILDDDDLQCLQKCQCPSCSSAQGLRPRLALLRKGFHNRSIHNAWVIANQFKQWPVLVAKWRSL